MSSVWEVSVPPSGPKKPRPHDLYPVRDRFIRAKYERRCFVAPLPVSALPSHAHEDEHSSRGDTDTGAIADAVGDPQPTERRSQEHMTPDELLRHSCETDDVIAALRSIAWGANICSAVRSPSVSSLLLVGKLPSNLTASPSIAAKGSLLHSSTIHSSSSLLLEQTCTDVTPIPCDEISIPKIDMTSCGLTEWSPLLIAAYNGSCACVALLLLSGADPYHAASTLCAESGPSSGTSYKSESMPLMEIAGRAGHTELVAYLHRKLDAMKAVSHESPTASPAPSPPLIDHLLKGDGIQITSDPSPSESLTTTLPDRDESSLAMQKEVSETLPSKRDQESTNEDELEDFYEALMSDIITPKNVP